MNECCIIRIQQQITALNSFVFACSKRCFTSYSSCILSGRLKKNLFMHIERYNISFLCDLNSILFFMPQQR